jgi:hypothetical protein
VKIQFSKLLAPLTRMQDWVPKRLIATGLVFSLLGLATFSVACKRNRKIEIVSRTQVSGSVNNAAFKGTITATINVGRGGHSSCAYEQLPPLFSPATIGTHA